MLHHFHVFLHALSTKLLPQSVDSFELHLCTRLPKPTSQGFPCLALSRQCPSILVSNICKSFSVPILLPELILRSRRPPVELVRLSTSPQGVQSIDELFLAGLF